MSHPRRFAEHQAGIGEGRDHHSVPVGEDLVVKAGADTRRTHGEKFGAQCGEFCFILLARRRRLQAVENSVAFEIPGWRDIVMARKKFAVGSAKLFDDVVVRPDVELSLFTF